tara:strand:- start:42 stop:458 length:417 start_codon:yes stop_codon:yes gene_type:complete
VEYLDEYVGLICVEGPEPRFEDILTVNLEDFPADNADGYLRFKITMDPIFQEVCAKNTISVTSTTASKPCVLGAHVEDSNVILQVINLTNAELSEIDVTIVVSGVRKDHESIRFPRYGEEEMIRNKEFWSQATRGPSQ